jgi:hypothetical protein
MKHHRKSRLHRRYGHSSATESLRQVPHSIRKVMIDHPLLTAAAIGGTAAALTAGLTGEAAMLAGAAAGIAIWKATEKKG